MQAERETQLLLLEQCRMIRRSVISNLATTIRLNSYIHRLRMNSQFMVSYQDLSGLLTRIRAEKSCLAEGIKFLIAIAVLCFHDQPIENHHMFMHISQFLWIVPRSRLILAEIPPCVRQLVEFRYRKCAPRLGLWPNDLRFELLYQGLGTVSSEATAKEKSRLIRLREQFSHCVDQSAPVPAIRAAPNQVASVRLQLLCPENQRRLFTPQCEAPQVDLDDALLVQFGTPNARLAQLLITKLIYSEEDPTPLFKKQRLIFHFLTSQGHPRGAKDDIVDYRLPDS
ncbi:hypothetical protein Ciccas_010437 [Cichlidogyrus casuarinus]|uniref:Uncharacterized protein n=1 Tax=Cichlidogyrus casuarinus TaxID=1844966 RepID=A0ABD2PUX9_9PLAT